MRIIAIYQNSKVQNGEEREREREANIMYSNSGNDQTIQ